jgi:hypothetical protein
MSIDKGVTKLNWDELLRSFAFGNSAENEGSMRQEIDRRIARLEKIEAAAKALLNDFRQPGGELRRRSDIRALDDAIKS